MAYYSLSLQNMYCNFSFVVVALVFGLCKTHDKASLVYMQAAIIFILF
jgi:hypothetical protein